MGPRVSNRIDARLDELAIALDRVLPGRVTGEPRTEDVGPAIWIEIPALVPNRQPGATLWWADFPVWAVFDGLDRAQVAGLNDITARIIDVVDSDLANAWVLGSRPVEVVAGERRRSVVTTVRMAIAARGLCQPDIPGESPIPPEPIHRGATP